MSAEAPQIQDRIEWPDPTPEMLTEPLFNAIWNVIKTWDVNVPGAYSGYCGATGNHVRAIYNAVRACAVEPEEVRRVATDLALLADPTCPATDHTAKRICREAKELVERLAAAGERR